jgi:diguanylate cyclase (GGDEF)-like protein
VSIEQLVLLALITVVLAVIASVAALASAVTMRREPSEPTLPGGLPLRRAGGGDGPRAGEADERPVGAHIRRVARVVAFLFLASTAVVVALTRLWPETETAIFTLLAMGTLLVLLFLDMLPDAWLGRARRPVEAVGALVFVAILMGLTGGIASPFFVGFFLIVAGTALSIEGWAPLAIAAAAAGLLAFVAVGVSGGAAVEPAGLAWLAFNTVTLVLLADIATAAGRAQRVAREEALQLSRFDPLTGLYNRSWLYTTLEHEIRRASRMGRSFALLMIDLDDLKPVNDTFGHQSGDRLLKGVAEVLQRTVRFTDSAARYGGDEFVVLLPETDAAGAYTVAEKLRRDIGALSVRALDRHVRTSISVGLVTYPEDGSSIEQLISAADIAMYEAKRRGKNQIVGYATRTERITTSLEREPATLGPAGRVPEDARYRATRPVGDEARGGVPEPAPGAPADSGTRAASATPAAGAGSAEGGVSVVGEAPWVTRAAPPRHLPDADPGSSAARGARHSGGRGRSGQGGRPARSEEPPARSARPWIALPIEGVDEPEERPPR